MDADAAQRRIIDANINRLGEGLRVLEEFARLALNDAGLAQPLKDMRHRLTHVPGALQARLVQARDAEEDVGSTMDAAGYPGSRDILDIVIANARRCQESLRVMEEMAKTPGSSLDSELYRRCRFELYTIEKTLIGKLRRQDKASKITGLYGVVDAEFLKGRDPALLAEQIIDAGVGVIQLRCKTLNARDFLAMAHKVKAVCADKGALFIVNDRLEIALAANADGLHIGQEDLPAATARRLITIDMLLGVSVQTAEMARQAAADGADYLGVGAIFATATKDSQARGAGIIREVKRAVNLPVAAIGGINKFNLKEVIGAGAESAAVISAVLGAADVKQAAAELVNIFKEQQRE